MWRGRSSPLRKRRSEFGSGPHTEPARSSRFCGIPLNLVFYWYTDRRAENGTGRVSAVVVFTIYPPSPLIPVRAIGTSC